MFDQLTYEIMQGFARSWGMVFLMVMFIGVIIYAVWPGNRQRFDRAARLPLSDNGAGPHDINNDDPKGSDK